MVQQYDSRDLLMKPVNWDREAVATRDADVAVPAWFEVELSHPEWPITVILTVAVDPDTGPRVTGIRAGRDSAATYRDAEVLFRGLSQRDELLTLATADAAGALAKERTFAVLPSDLAPEKVTETLARVGDLVSRQAYPKVRPQQRRRMTRKFLRQVADVYRSAVAEGDAPTGAVREHFHVSHSTAARWVGEARKVGELGPAKGPTGGELATDGEGGDGGDAATA